MSLFKKFFGEYDEAAEAGAQEVVINEDDSGETPVEQYEETGEEGQLALDVYQNKDNVVIQSTIAGVKPEDLDITIANDMVTIRGERKREEVVSAENYFSQECYWGGFYRSFNLPVEVDVDKAQADMKDGVLTITLPKAARAKAKKVKVKSSID